MAAKRDTSSGSFTSAMALSEMGLNGVPECYILPQPQRPAINQRPHCPTIALPVIDLSLLENPSLRPKVIEQVLEACKELGVFQVINHGIQISFTDDALDVAEEFFNCQMRKRCVLLLLMFENLFSIGETLSNITLIQSQLGSTCGHQNHQVTRRKWGNYAKVAHILHKKLMEVVLESLGLRPDYLQKDIEEGSQVMAVNCYPACPEPNLALGLPPHSDYGSLTIILQNQQGLEIKDSNGEWQSVSFIKEALVVQLGDQLEVLSNGRYKSVIHRAILNSEKRRLSIASLHSLAIDRKVIPAPELVDEQHPLSYKEGSFGDFLHFIQDNDILEGRYIDTLKKNPQTGSTKETADQMHENVISHSSG
ncbi:UNVERIFIED_CONTAM: Flavanone 3-dioxygenase 3 [Sesamum latifolium]|uniref:Flavanone 3-dioxygenase 3 n=1 Tax=Sesamum latifolium TaxID=2727402 RepID=A0AAW2YFI1_9LAMI